MPADQLKAADVRARVFESRPAALVRRDKLTSFIAFL
jgi:hypothetical protein